MPSFLLAEEIATEEPLATCAVQEVAPPKNNNAMPDGVVLNGIPPAQANVLDNYSRGTDGQWQIPQQVDRTNPWLRLLVLGPQQPTLVEIAVYVEGESFTEAREKLIDNLLNHATVESLVRDAVSVPVPSETATLPAEEEPKEEPEIEVPATEKVAEEETGAESKAAATEENEQKEAEKVLVAVKAREARTVAQRLVNYMASAEVKADREEIRWLLSEWTGGPAILNLGPAMNWQRVGFAPLWNALDVDGDQKLSAAEIAAATERMAQADVDENSIVELEELFAMGSRNTTAPHSYPLVVVLDEETDWRRLHADLQVAYGRRVTDEQGSAASATPALLDRIAVGDPTLTAQELESLLNEPSDVKLRVTLGDKDNKNEVALLAVKQSELSEDYSASEQVVTVVRGAEYLEFSAGQTKQAEASEPVATQIAVGAVVDGYPLFRLADRNGDRRLSARERRVLPNVLAALDLDGDGQITQSEKPTAIRLAITRGPHVHELLAAPTSAHREFARRTGTNESSSPAAEPAATVPAWFTDMDRNRDGDLSRGEFLGTSEQFQQLDRDGDGLVGSQEATE